MEKKLSSNNWKRSRDTEKDKKIIQLLKEGKSPQEITEKVGVSLTTVQRRKQALETLGEEAATTRKKPAKKPIEETETPTFAPPEEKTPTDLGPEIIRLRDEEKLHFKQIGKKLGIPERKANVLYYRTSGKKPAAKQLSDLDREIVRLHIIEGLDTLEIRQKLNLQRGRARQAINRGKSRPDIIEEIKAQVKAELVQGYPENPTIEATYATYGETQGGKTLLEDFAGQAMHSFIALHGGLNPNYDLIAQHSFKTALAMLKEAEKYRKIYEKIKKEYGDD